MSQLGRATQPLVLRRPERSQSAGFFLDAGRHQQRNELSRITPVDAEVCIGCEDAAVFMEFRQADHTRVGQRHGQLLVGALQTQQAIHFVLDAQAHSQCPSVKHLEYLQGVSSSPDDQMLGLGQDGFARIERCLAPAEFRPCPTMMDVARVQQRDERAGINDGFFGHGGVRL